MELNTSAHVIISGRVQGVFFRVETKRAAEKIGLAGWVRNCNDGTVEAFFQGPRIKVEQAIAWCHKGPPMAHVTEVKVSWQDFVGDLGGFSIKS